MNISIGNNSCIPDYYVWSKQRSLQVLRRNLSHCCLIQVKYTMYGISIIFWSTDVAWLQGSSATWVPLEGCGRYCGFPPHTMQPTASTSFKVTNMPFSIRYGEGFARGYFAQDTITLEGNISIPNAVSWYQNERNSRDFACWRSCRISPFRTLTMASLQWTAQVSPKTDWENSCVYALIVDF